VTRTILLVDDEPNILRSLVRVLRRDAYNILTAGSGAEGLEMLADNEVGVIISDQRMPGMTGTEFLSQVKERYPDTVRMVLSGYTDLNSITDAINQGAIYKFLTKPWDDELLRDNVRQAFEHHELRSENKRLTEELRLANEALSRQLAVQDQELSLHHRILDLSQQVLEQLPVGVLGIGTDGMIALANSRVHTLLGRGAGELLEQEAGEVLPRPLAEICTLASAPPNNQPQTLQLETLGTVYIYCSCLGSSGEVLGKVLVLLPQRTGD
jgi:FixJ family two-component response regulator